MTDATPELLALVELIQRSGADGYQIRYQDDEKPTVWVAVATYPGDAAEVAAGVSPLAATFRLAERLLDGGTCTHCEKPTSLVAAGDHSDAHGRALAAIFCVYAFDPAAGKYERACA